MFSMREVPDTRQSFWLHCERRRVSVPLRSSAIALAITRASLEGNHQHLLKEFDDVFLKTFGENNQDILDHFGDYVRLNGYGFLMGPFLREVDRAAKDARFSSNRVKIPEMIQKILTHMLEFQPVNFISTVGL